MKIVLATKNKGKAAEFASILGDKFELITQAEAGITESAEENGTTYAENSRLKAKFIFEKTGLPTMADDSGLECDALDGAPGVYTARFAGEGATDSTNIDKLLAVLDEEENRKARFVAHITLVMENYEIHCEGTLDGEITRGRRGTNGFGYDPVFIPEGYDKTLAELDDEVKNSISPLMEETLGQLAIQEHTETSTPNETSDTSPNLTSAKSLTVSVRHTFLTDIPAEKAGPQPAVLIPTTEFLDPVIYANNAPEPGTKQAALYNALLSYIGTKLEKSNTSTPVTVQFPRSNLNISSLTIQNVSHTRELDAQYKNIIQTINDQLQRLQVSVLVTFPS